MSDHIGYVEFDLEENEHVDSEHDRGQISASQVLTLKFND